MGRPSTEYADTIVTDLFNRSIEEAQVEAVVAMNVWMAVVHELYSIFTSCHSIFDGPASLLSLEKVAFLWIGAEQELEIPKLEIYYITSLR